MTSVKECMFPGCYFGIYKGELWCNIHSRIGDTDREICMFKMCDKPANCSIRGVTMTCKDHRLLNFTQIPQKKRKRESEIQIIAKRLKNNNHKSCESEGCIINPSFGLIGGKRRWCVVHKQANAVNLVRYGKKPSPKAVNLGKKPSPKAVNLDKKPSPKAVKEPVYETKTLYISEPLYLKIIPKINKDSECEAPDCVQVPIYAYPNQRWKWCITHKPCNTPLVKKLKCDVPACDKYSDSGYQGGLCSYHQSKNGKKKAICEAWGCNTNSHYGYKKAKRRWCVIHKPIPAVSL